MFEQGSAFATVKAPSLLIIFREVTFISVLFLLLPTDQASDDDPGYLSKDSGLFYCDVFLSVQPRDLALLLCINHIFFCTISKIRLKYKASDKNIMKHLLKIK